MKTAYIHIGFHKTGSTSIQAFMQTNRAFLAKQGVGFYQGIDFPDNHVELHVASMRRDRESGYKNRTGVCPDLCYIQSVKDNIKKFVEQTNLELFVFSSEGLSLLRHKDELMSLKDLIPIANIKIVAYLRNNTDYIRSYANQLRKDPKTLPSTIKKDSFAYTESDSWLLNYTMRLAPFVQVFGDENVIVVDYDSEMKRVGTVLPSFFQTIGLDITEVPDDIEKYFLAKSLMNCERK